jgi:predicted nucleic-acid-binding protein
MKKYVIDTNVIIRYLLSDDKELYKKAYNFFDLLKPGKAKAYLEQTVLTETVFVLSKVYNASREDIAKALSNLLLLKGILNEEKDILTKALTLYASTELHIVDCIIAAKCMLGQIVPMTFDVELKKIVSESKASPLD